MNNNNERVIGSSGNNLLEQMTTVLPNSNINDEKRTIQKLERKIIFAFRTFQMLGQNNMLEQFRYVPQGSAVVLIGKEAVSAFMTEYYLFSDIINVDLPIANMEPIKKDDFEYEPKDQIEPEEEIIPIQPIDPNLLGEIFPEPVYNSNNLRELRETVDYYNESYPMLSGFVYKGQPVTYKGLHAWEAMVKMQDDQKAVIQLYKEVEGITKIKAKELRHKKNIRDFSDMIKNNMATNKEDKFLNTCYVIISSLRKADLDQKIQLGDQIRELFDDMTKIRELFAAPKPNIDIEIKSAIDNFNPKILNLQSAVLKLNDPRLDLIITKLKAVYTKEYHMLLQSALHRLEEIKKAEKVKAKAEKPSVGKRVGKWFLNRAKSRGKKIANGRIATVVKWTGGFVNNVFRKLPEKGFKALMRVITPSEQDKMTSGVEALQDVSNATDYMKIQTDINKQKY